jgi:hypothetical protein
LALFLHFLRPVSSNLIPVLTILEGLGERKSHFCKVTYVREMFHRGQKARGTLLAHGVKSGQVVHPQIAQITQINRGERLQRRLHAKPQRNEKTFTAENAENAERDSWGPKTESFSALSAFSAVQSVVGAARRPGHGDLFVQARPLRDTVTDGPSGVSDEERAAERERLRRHGRNARPQRLPPSCLSRKRWRGDKVCVDGIVGDWLDVGG